MKEKNWFVNGNPVFDITSTDTKHLYQNQIRTSWNLEMEKVEGEQKRRWKFLWLTSWKTNYILSQRDTSDDEKGPKTGHAENKEKLLRVENKQTKERNFKKFKWFSELCLTDMCCWLISLKGKWTHILWDDKKVFVQRNKEGFIKIEAHSISLSNFRNHFSAFGAIPLFQPWWPFDTTDKSKPPAFHVLLHSFWQNLLVHKICLLDLCHFCKK